MAHEKKVINTLYPWDIINDDIFYTVESPDKIWLANNSNYSITVQEGNIINVPHQLIDEIKSKFYDDEKIKKFLDVLNKRFKDQFEVDFYTTMLWF